MIILFIYIYIFTIHNLSLNVFLFHYYQSLRKKKYYCSRNMHILLKLSHSYTFFNCFDNFFGSSSLLGQFFYVVMGPYIYIYIYTCMTKLLNIILIRILKILSNIKTCVQLYTNTNKNNIILITHALKIDTKISVGY